MIFFTKVFYDINTYKKVLKWGVIKTCTYFFILCTILTVSLLITVYTPIKTNYVECIENVKDALSKIKIIDGKVVPLKEGSIQIKDKNNKVFAIISANAIEPTKIKELLFSIEGTRFSMYQDGKELSINMNDLDFGKSETAQSLADAIPPWSFIKFFILPATMFFTCVSISLWNIIVLGTFAFIVDMPYKQIKLLNALKLAIVASTPAIFINLIYAILFSKIMPESVIVLISAIMLYYVSINIIRVKNAQQQQ